MKDQEVTESLTKCYFCDKTLSVLYGGEMVASSESYYYTLSVKYIRGSYNPTDFKSICKDCIGIELKCLDSMIDTYIQNLTKKDKNSAVNLHRCFGCQKPWSDWRQKRLKLTMVQEIEQNKRIVEGQIGEFCTMCSKDTFGIS